MTESRRGFLLGVAAYGIWGLFPLYWPLLEPAGAVEILAHRIVWSLRHDGPAGARCCAAPRWSARSPPTAVPAGSWRSAACLITVNWAVYIWGVNNGHVVETSLGYFMNPLVTVLMGVFILGERLRRLQWVALGGRRARRRRPDPRLRPAAVDRADPGAHLRQLRAVQEAGERPGHREPDLRDDGDRPGRPRLSRLADLARRSPNFADHGPGHVLLLMSAGIVTAVPLVLLRRRRDPGAAGDARAAAVPHPDPAVRARRPVLPRGHAGRSLGRLRAGVGGAGHLHRRVVAPSPYDVVAASGLASAHPAANPEDASSLAPCDRVAA